MNMLLKQARKGFKALIDENRQDISVSIPGNPDIPVGWPGHNPVDIPFSGRISHESSRKAPIQVPGTAGITPDLNRYLLVEYSVNILKKGYIITDSLGAKWKLGAVDKLEKFGSIHGYQSPLEEAS